jgi:hypothetical protein
MRVIPYAMLGGWVMVVSCRLFPGWSGWVFGGITAAALGLMVPPVRKR